MVEKKSLEILSLENLSNRKNIARKKVGRRKVDRKFVVLPSATYGHNFGWSKTLLIMTK